jgi:tetratricopeptide (TPR) repeat protein
MVRLLTVRASVVSCVVGVACTLAAVANAAPGTASLEHARHAWDDGEIDQAEHAYQEALEKGGLDRTSTLECWVRLGAARAVLGNKNGALTAYRVALFIDDSFQVPAEAGKKAAAIAETARRQLARIGSLHVTVSAPSEAPSGEPFAVLATLDASHASLIPHVAIHVTDKTTHKTYDDEQPSAAAVRFRVPATMTLPGATLHVAVDALDAHDNQLATDEQVVSVRPTPIAESHPIKDELRPKHGGFWSTAWPYVIGGALIAAGGATAGYFLLKPPDQVSIGAATIVTH